MARARPVELVGTYEIASRLGLARPEAVHALRYRRADFPDPIARLQMGFVWRWADVEKWAKKTGRSTPRAGEFEMATIEKKKTKSGEARYEVRWRTSTPARTGEGFREASQTFHRLEDAREHRTKVEAEKRTGRGVDPAGGKMTFEELSELWLASNPGKRQNTIGRDRSALRSHILPEIGGRELRNLRQTDMQGLVNTWTKKMAPKTVDRTYGTLRAAFAYAVTADLIARSPCRNVKLPQIVLAKREPLMPDDVVRLIDAMDDRYRAAVWVAALLGLRWGEVFGLRVGQLDILKTRTLTVTEIVTRDERGRPVVGPPKSAAGNRTMSMPQLLVDVLAEHLARFGLTADAPDSYVFPAPGGGAWPYSNFRRRFWLPAVARAGLDGLGFHDLRRMAATAFVGENVDLKTAQIRLGHSDPRLTLAVYAQATTEADRTAADRVGERFSRGIGTGSRDGRGTEAENVVPIDRAAEA